MSDYRRWYVPGGTYFFTIVAHERRKFLTSELARKCLRDAIHDVQADHPFEIVAIVLLPDHLHTLWSLPAGDARYSMHWRLIKSRFTEAYLKAGGQEGKRTNSRQRRRERGIWQRRFWEHVCEDEDDFDAHFDYIHWNPVKHGLVSSPSEWPYSTFRRWVNHGVYDPGWGADRPPRDFDLLAASDYD